MLFMRCKKMFQATLIETNSDHIIPTFVTFLNFIAAPEVLQRHHGDVLEGQVHRSVGHGVANRNQPQTRSGKKNREYLLTPAGLTLWLKCVF